MKNFILIITICLLLTSCAANYKPASLVSSKAYIGMPISEFKQMAGKKASLEALESGYTVYKINDYDAWTGERINIKFFYFDSNGKLTKIDGGQFKQSRYQVEIINH